jgi:hypothetical protein
MSQVKFKIGFTIPSDTLIAMIAKYLPIEDLSVEEIVPIKTDRVVTGIQSHPQIPHKPKPQVNKRASRGPNLKKGINGLIMAELSTGPRSAKEMQPKVTAAGYAASSVNSRMEELRRFGVIEPVGNGLWRSAHDNQARNDGVARKGNRETEE